MELFYAPEISIHTTLGPDESRHCIKVLRHKKDDIIHLIDGSGRLYVTKIISPDPRATVVELVETKEDFGIVPYDLTVGLPPLKKPDRYEWFVEKATEIGVSRILPFLSRYTEKKTLKYERLQRIIIAAAKQSLHAKFPEILPLRAFDEILDFPAEQRFVALCDAQTTLSQVYERGKSTLVLIGPEGGFSGEEKQKLLAAGFVGVKIGHSRLRAETAAIVATALVANFNL